jgi:hypothetical protein
MNAPRLLKLSTRGATGPADAVWSLPHGQATSLRPRQNATLQVTEGHLWVTFDGPHSGHGNESGDYFLSKGEQLLVRAGQRLVVEPLGQPGAPAARLQWAPAPATTLAPNARQSRQGGAYGVREMACCDAV